MNAKEQINKEDLFLKLIKLKESKDNFKSQDHSVIKITINL